MNPGNAPRARGLLLCLAMLAAVSVQAQSLPTVNLREFLALVERNSPELGVSQQQRAIADAESLIARAYPNPEVEIGAGPWRSRVGGSGGTASAYGITQPIELPSVRSARIGAATAGIESAGAATQAVRLAIGYQARQAFFELQRRQEDERIARENMTLLEQIRNRVQKRVEVGEAPRFELVRAESEALVAQNALAASGLRVEEARASLRRLTANSLPPEFEVRGAEPDLLALPPLATLQPEMIAAHPTLRALAAERERAQQRLAQERALRAPQPALRAGEVRDPEMRSTMLGVTLTIPLWNRREGQVAQAGATIELLSAQIEQQRVQLLRELDSAYARFAIAQRQIGTFEAGLLRSAAAALQGAEAAYRFGERGFLEVLDAQRTLRAVRGDYNQMRYDRVAAWLDIERLRARDPFLMEKS